jgi:hypothetical protein
VNRLFLWRDDDWIDCPPDQITWLDRGLLSGNEDPTLHRAPRCAGLRYVEHDWELFSRDTTHRIYLAPGTADAAPDAVRRAASQVLPVTSARYEARPVVLEGGLWLVSIGSWVVRLRLEPSPLLDAGELAGEPASGSDMVTRESTVSRVTTGRGRAPDAVGRVHTYFQRNDRARLAMAYYYREFIRGLPAAQPVPMLDVVVALDLSGEGAVSDYKKLLQGLIWSERGHARDLAGFLLANDLLTPTDLDEALRTAAGNERAGVCERARQRLKYRPKGT